MMQQTCGKFANSLPAMQTKLWRFVFWTESIDVGRFRARTEFGTCTWMNIQFRADFNLSQLHEEQFVSRIEDQRLLPSATECKNGATVEWAWPPVLPIHLEYVVTRCAHFAKINCKTLNIPHNFQGNCGLRPQHPCDVNKTRIHLALVPCSVNRI